MVKAKVVKKITANTHSSHAGRLIFSAAAAGIVGAAAALLLAPKSGSKLREDLYETYQDLSEYAQDHGKKNHDLNLPLIIGAIGGGILGAGLAFYMASHETQKPLVKGLGQRLKQAGKSAAENLRTTDWVETAKDLVEALHNKMHNEEEEVEEEEEPKTLNDVLHWAQLGLRVWQNMKQRS